MTWVVEFVDEFATEVDGLSESVADEIRAHALLLEQFGPHLGRPTCDTLKGSAHSNMKELRFRAAGGVWRVAFAFDTDRRAILLVAGDKRGLNEAKFYKALIKTADARFSSHLKILERRRKPASRNKP